MKRFGFWACAIAVSACGLSCAASVGQTRTGTEGASERARMVFAQALPAMNGAQLKTKLIEVRYGPGESSPPHSHTCPVVGYVLEGAIRSQVRGEEEKVYKAGETFYEPPHGVHQVSANASQTDPARLLAIFVCDSDAALTTAPQENEGKK